MLAIRDIKHKDMNYLLTFIIIIIHIIISIFVYFHICLLLMFRFIVRNWLLPGQTHDNNFETTLLKALFSSYWAE